MDENLFEEELTSKNSLSPWHGKLKYGLQIYDHMIHLNGDRFLGPR